MEVGAPELLIILVVALLIFGPSQLPKLSRSLGQAAHEFRHGSESLARHPEATSGVADDGTRPLAAEPPPQPDDPHPAE
jgi:sec-independent protein translocase protein TatA